MADSDSDSWAHREARARSFQVEFNGMRRATAAETKHLNSLASALPEGEHDLGRVGDYRPTTLLISSL